MGVPVVTLLGDRHGARVSASILRTVGLEACVAQSRPDFVRTAALLARSPEVLTTLRRTLRDGMRRSPLCDAAGFTSSFLRLAEERLAAGQPPGGSSVPLAGAA
jgi:predicted O-linked N-acetylglucosamine transferase (SPINDLY family)